MIFIPTRAVMLTAVLCLSLCRAADVYSSDLSSSPGAEASKHTSLHLRNRFQVSVLNKPHGNFSSKSFDYILTGRAKAGSSLTDTAKNDSLKHGDITRDGVAQSRVNYLSGTQKINLQRISASQSLKFGLRTKDAFVSPGIRSSRLSRLHSKFLKPYVKYPSPFPEDNAFQKYSGSSRQPEDRLHALLNNSYPYPMSSESYFDNHPYQRHPFKAQEDAQKEDSSSVDFPGLFGAPPIQYSSLSGPSFVPNSKEDYYAVAGTTAILTCAIRNLHNYTVSWVRGRDIRLLTTGLITYTSDKRFVPSNPSRGQDWLLKIHYSRKQDAGAYLCQVSLSPPITRTLYLHVHEAEVHIVPGQEVHVQVGSTLHLECHVRGCTHPVPGWRHEGRSLPPSETEGFIVEEIPQFSPANITHEGKNSSVDPKSSTLGVDDGEEKKSTVEKRSSLARERRDFRVINTRSMQQRIQRSLPAARNFPEEVTNISGSPRVKNSQHQGEVVPQLNLADFDMASSDVDGPEVHLLRVKKSAPAGTLKYSDSNTDHDDSQGVLTQNLPDGPIGGAGIELFTSTTAPESPPYTTIVTVTRKGVTPQHSGIYTCTSTCTPPINVTVHVLRGEELAAIHHQNGGCGAYPSLVVTTAALTALCVSILLTGTDHRPLQCRHKSSQCRQKPLQCRHKSSQCRQKPLQCRHKSLQCRQKALQWRCKSLQCSYKSLQCRQKPFQSQHKNLQGFQKPLQCLHKSSQCRQKPFQYRQKPLQCRQKPFQCRHKMTQDPQEHKLAMHKRLRLPERLEMAQMTRKASLKGNLGSMKHARLRRLIIAARLSSAAILHKQAEIRHAFLKEICAERRTRRSFVNDFFLLRSALSKLLTYISVTGEQIKLKLRVIPREETYRVMKRVESSTNGLKLNSSETAGLDPAESDKNKALWQVFVEFFLHRSAGRNSVEGAQKGEKHTTQAEKYEICLKCYRPHLLASTAAKYGANLLVDTHTQASDYHELPGQMDGHRTSVISRKSSDSFEKLQQAPCLLELIYGSGVRFQIDEEFCATNKDHQKLSRVSNGKWAHSCDPFTQFGALVNLADGIDFKRRMRSATFQFGFLVPATESSCQLTAGRKLANRKLGRFRLNFNKRVKSERKSFIRTM